MIPNNNISPLPWYKSVSFQNARKWWIYNRIYPLFAPLGYLPSFQITTPVLVDLSKWAAFVATIRPGELSGTYPVPLAGDGTYLDLLASDFPDGKVYLQNIPWVDPDDYMIMAVNSQTNEVIDTVEHPNNDTQAPWSGIYTIPAGADTILVQVLDHTTQDVSEITARVGAGYAKISAVEVYNAHSDSLVGSFAAGNPFFSAQRVYNFGDTDIVTYYSDLQSTIPQGAIDWAFGEGQYYLKATIGTEVYFSEVFTIVGTAFAPEYLTIRWWDSEDFVMDAGRIVYQDGYKNSLMLNTSLAKPEYPFEEEGETRDGYFFPTKQISEKHYRFKFFASEYLLDVMRFIRMSDYVEIYYNGQRYSLDTFLITPEWEDNGDVASVEAEFDTATVAKKIGLAYVKARRGDFNDDFNNDFNNQQ